MNMLRYIGVWVLAFVFTSLIDALWHLGIFGRIYREGIKPLARMNGDKMAFIGWAGLLSQVMVVTTVMLLVLLQPDDAGFARAGTIGALAGVLAISVYGITNYALLKDWGLALTVLEMIWGPIIGAASGIFVLWAKSLLIR
jgi:uncharacterized membrane protein